ncbi:MAG: lysophospholipid acyltransferase family protein, partial [Terriglobia bacterium]
GNIPVPLTNSPSAVKELLLRTRAALDAGTSVIAFPEGSRTRDGRVGPFQQGVFRVAKRLGCPIVPMSIVGSYEFKRVGSWLLHPAKIVVHLHDTLETQGLRKDEVEALRERVHRIVSGPVEAARRDRAER